MYPRININLEHYLENIKYLSNELVKLDEIFIVTKAYSANSSIIERLYQEGYRMFADSRLDNLKAIKQAYPQSTTMQLRLPQVCEISELVKYADRSLNSELKTIKLINEECLKQDLSHDIILMIDLGDLREGIMFNEDYLAYVKEILTYEKINLIGIGTNVTCYGSIIPTQETLNILVAIKNEIEKEFNIKIPIISGGNSSSVYLHFEDRLPKEINNLRIGDTFISGMETAYSKQLEGMHNDVFQLEAQIIELKNKPSYPIGLLGVNSFGEKVEYENVGNHTRAIIAIGRQDVSDSDIIPLDKDVVVLGSSSDHLILQVNDHEYQVGDTIKFNLKYGGVLSLFTSKYVNKHLCK